MTTYLGQLSEVDELNKILQSILQINGSMKRLDVNTDEMYIVLPREDYVYICRVVEQNKTSKFYKFYSKRAEDNFFRLGNIKVQCGVYDG